MYFSAGLEVGSILIKLNAISVSLWKLSTTETLQALYGLEI